MTHPLEPPPDDLRALIAALTDRVVPYVDSLPDQPATYTDAAAVDALARSLEAPVPREPQPLDAVLSVLFDQAVPASFNAPGPSYLAYIPGGGVVHGALGGFLADVINRYTGIWAAAPALLQLEANVLRWMVELVGLPATARGLLCSGGSMANFTAVFTARRERLDEQFLDGTVYVSDQVHHSVAKAALLAGFPPSHVRAVPSHDDLTLDVAALEAAVGADRARGLRPFLVVGTGGTTNTGAVDPLEALADVCAREHLWLHVDAAYGGFFCLTERGRAQLAGIERADSVTLDPHKGLFMPYGLGALLVRDGAALVRAHEVAADYLPDPDEDPTRLDYNRMSPELSRPYRGLPLWLPLQLCGADAFRDALDEKLDLIAYAAEVLDAMAHVDVLARPRLTALAFRYAPPGLDEAALDALNRRILARIVARKRVLLTPTLLHGRFVIRICILNFRTHRDRVDMALEDIRAAIAEVASE